MLRCCLLFIVLTASVFGQSAPAASGTGTPQFEIRGTLINSRSGEKVIGAEVRITPYSRPDENKAIITDDEGHFVFTGLAKGKYTLSAKRPGYVAQAFEAHQGFSTGIAVGENLDSSHLLFLLSPECSIAGTVSDEAGEAVRNARLTLYQIPFAGGTERARKQVELITDDRGYYHFNHLAPGRYIVSVAATVWYAQRPTSKPNTVITTISGGGYTMTSYSPFSDAPEQLEADNGRSPLDVAYPLTFYPGATEFAAATPIKLKDGESFIADVGLQPQPALHIALPALNASGRIIGLERSLADGITLPVTAEIRTTSSGEIDIVGVLPGQYTMRYAASGEPDKTVSQKISLLSSGELGLQEASGSHVIVNLQNKLGSTARTPYLRLTNKTTGVYYDQPITGKDEVEFKQLVPPGTYELGIGNSGNSYIRLITGSGVSGRTIQLKEGRPAELKIFLGEGKVLLTGIVINHERPFAGAVVLLVPENPANNEVLFRRDQSDSDGTFTIAATIPGKYTLLAIEKGWELNLTNPEVLEPYIAKGTPLEVKPNEKYDVKVILQ